VGNDAIVQPLQAQKRTFSRSQTVTEDINTHLTPFTHSDGSSFTSRDVSSARNIYTFAYAYPEVPVKYRTRSNEDLTTFAYQAVTDLYNPDDVDETVNMTTEAPSSDNGIEKPFSTANKRGGSRGSVRNGSLPSRLMK